MKLKLIKILGMAFGIVLTVGIVFSVILVNASNQASTNDNTSDEITSEEFNSNEVDEKSYNFNLRWDTKGFYNVEAYYQEPYAILVGWTQSKTPADNYKTTANIAIGEQTTMPAYFHDHCIKGAEDEELLQTLSTFLPELKRSIQDSRVNKSTPIIFQYKRIGTDVEVAAKEGYEDDNSPAFFDVAGYLSARVQKDPSLSKEKKVLEDYTEKTFQDGSQNFFFSLINLQSDEIRLKYVDKAYEENTELFYCLLTPEIDKNIYLKYAEKAYVDNHFDVFSVICEYLSSSEIKAYQERAKRDGRDDVYQYLN